MENVIAYIYGEPRRDSSGFRHWNNGTVLCAFGEVVPEEFTNQGTDLSDWIIEELTPPGMTGLLVWEGSCSNLWSRHHGDDWEPRLFGFWRPIGNAELLALRHEPQPTFDSAYLGC